MNIAVFGSAACDPQQQHIDSAYRLGTVIAQRGHTLVTGGCVGIPSYAIAGAFEHNGETHGYFPVDSEDQIHSLARIYNNDTADHYTTKTFLRGFSKRSIAIVENVDAVVMVNGRMGTLSEFTMAVEENVPIVIMKGSGGVTEHIETILNMVGRDISERLYFAGTPEEAMSWIENFNK